MRRSAALAAVTSAALLAPTAASAVWSAQAQGATAVKAATMTNAGAFTAACAGRAAPNSLVSLTWTVSPDPFVDGYEIVRTGPTTGTTTVILITSRAQSSYTDTVADKTGNSYSYTIRATSSTAWRVPPLAATGSPTFTANNTCTA